MKLGTRLASIAGLAAMLIGAPVSAALVNYSQNFEALNAADGAALGNAGFKGFGIRYDGAASPAPYGNVAQTYGVFPAPNGGPGFSAIASGEGGPAQGNQYINIYNDYNCCGAGLGHNDSTSPFDVVQSIVFQEQTIGAADIGSIWNFTFDAKLPDNQFACGGGSECRAFIKTLDPNAGFAQTNFIAFNSGGLLSKTAWSTQTLQINLANAQLNGQILQFGFESVARQFGPTGVFYDNLSFTAVPAPPAVWLLATGCAAVAARWRRKKRA